MRAVYIQKELQAQIAEKEALKFDSHSADVEIVLRMNENAGQDHHQHKVIRQQKMLNYKQELDRQIQERKLSERKAYDEFLREKSVIDEISRKIYEEDQQ